MFTQSRAICNHPLYRRLPTIISHGLEGLQTLRKDAYHLFAESLDEATFLRPADERRYSGGKAPPEVHLHTL